MIYLKKFNESFNIDENLEYLKDIFRESNDENFNISVIKKEEFKSTFFNLNPDRRIPFNYYNTYVCSIRCKAVSNFNLDEVYELINASIDYMFNYKYIINCGINEGYISYNDINLLKKNKRYSFITIIFYKTIKYENKLDNSQTEWINIDNDQLDNYTTNWTISKD